MKNDDLDICFLKTNKCLQITKEKIDKKEGNIMDNKIK
jgi:tRNA U34 2-thiouridine synthase MnmA/TrmU